MRNNFLPLRASVKSKILLGLFLIFPSLLFTQNYLNGPECVSYDVSRNCYYVSSFNSGSIVCIDSNGVQTVFKSGLGRALGNYIVGDTLFVSSGTRITGYHLDHGSQVMDLAIPGSVQIDGITADTSGHLYGLDSNLRKIFCIDILSQQYSVFLDHGLPPLPQDALYDAPNNRLILCGFLGHAPILAVNLADTTLDTLVITPMGSFDGICADEHGNLYLSSWETLGIHRYHDNCINPPATIISGLNGPANICYNPKDRVIAVPEFNANRVLFIPVPQTYLTPRFRANITSGHAPVQIQFEDLSRARPPITSWGWDFDNDGNIDSQDPNPQWTFTDPGTYDVRLQLSSDSLQEEFIMTEYIRVFSGESALSFDGEQSSVSYDSTQALHFSDQLTLEAWIYPEGWGENSVYGQGRIIDKQQISLYLQKWHPAFPDSCLVLKLSLANGSTVYGYTPDRSIHLACWQHVAVTYNGHNNMLKMYIDGIDQSVTFSALPSGFIADNSQSRFILGNDEGGAYTFAGVIDDVRLWGIERTEQEIRTHWGQLLLGTEPGLSCYWPMNEGNGDSLIDLSPFGHHALIHGATWVTGTPFSASFIQEGHPGIVAQSPELYPNYPNPFNGSTRIRFYLPQSAAIVVRVFDVTGRLIKSLFEGDKEKGIHQVVWDGLDGNGDGVSSGIYFLQMTTDQYTLTSRMQLLK